MGHLVMSRGGGGKKVEEELEVINIFCGVSRRDRFLIEKLLALIVQEECCRRLSRLGRKTPAA